MLLHGRCEACFGEPVNNKRAQENADGDAEERQGTYAIIPVPHLLERNRICLEKEVDDGIYKSDVDGEKDQNWLEEKHDEGLDEVLVHQCLDINLHFIPLRVDRPIFRLVPNPSGAILKNDRAERFGNDENGNGAKEKGHDSSNVLCPSPSEMAHSNKATNDGTSNRALMRGISLRLFVFTKLAELTIKVAAANMQTATPRSTGSQKSANMPPTMARGAQPKKPPKKRQIIMV
jgi:hypothetical protein